MPENEFEKRVQQKMDELQFTPSHATWQKVEKEISVRKKRRPAIIWFWFVLLLIGGATWLYYSKAGADYKKRPDNKINVNVIKDRQVNAIAGKATGKQEIKPIFEEAVNTAKKSIPEKSYPDTAELHSQHTIVTVKNILRKGGVKDDHVMHAANTMLEKDKKNTSGAMKKNPADVGGATYKQNILVDNGKAIVRQLPSVESIAGHSLPASDQSVKIENNKSGQTISADSTATPATGLVTNNTTKNLKAIATDSIKPAKKAATTKTNISLKECNKLAWGVRINAGLSGIFNEIPGVSSAIPASYTNGQVYNGSNQISGPSVTRPGFAFAAGVVAGKPLGKHYRLLTALHYYYVSTHMKTGAKIDSSGAAIQYHTGNTSVYTNRFYFVELPVTVQKQLGTASHFSVEAGMAVSLLSGSRALQYNQQTDTYYIGNSLINRLQLGILAGLNYRLVDKTFSIETGPQFNYGLTNIFEKQLSGSRHLFFAGISTKIFFRKNKH